MLVLLCIGRILLDGFFASDQDILVPVKRSPSDVHLSLIPSTEAFLSTSKHIQSFLPVPLVPFDISRSDFFRSLKNRRWIDEIDPETVVVKLHESILLSSEFVELIRWLCSKNNTDRSYIKRALSKIHFRETFQSTIVKLEKLEFYDAFNIPHLPLPLNVLPACIVSHISREDLHKRLSLSAVPVKNLVQFYLSDSQHYLLDNENTAVILLSFISQHWNQWDEAEWTRIRSALSTRKCIPTSQGMKSPNESYIRSSNLSSDLPIITLYVPHSLNNDNEKNKPKSTEYSVSIEFLKMIGCRTIHVPTSSSNVLSDHSQTPLANTQTIQVFIQDLLQQRKNMSDNDLHALKFSECISGKFADVFFTEVRFQL
jgi:hypothetical protein